MQKYVKDYLKGMGYDVKFLSSHDFIPCEICQNLFDDVHHIDRRGMGGTKKEYHVEEMMGLCRDDHTFFGDKKKYRSYLFWVHFIRMKNIGVDIDFDKLPKDLFYDQYSDEQKITSSYYSLLINNDYIEQITSEFIGNGEKITILITTRKGKKITEQSGYDKFELQKSIIPILL